MLGLGLSGWAKDADSWQNWHYEAFATEQGGAVGDGVVEHWTIILDYAGPWVTMVQL